MRVLCRAWPYHPSVVVVYEPDGALSFVDLPLYKVRVVEDLQYERKRRSLRYAYVLNILYR